LSASAWRDRLAAYLRSHHPRLTVDDMEPTATKGYWQTKEPCGPDCRNPVHSTLFNSERARHTVRFVEPSRDRGRFMRPYRAWEEARTDLSDAA
jgi:hypothetical protein